MRHLLALSLLLAIPAVAHAQTATIAPGMSRAQVVAAFGEPVNARLANEYTYLFYRNDCGKACGINDLVILRRDSVVDAILRSPSRRYSGTSSSPAPLTRSEARSGVASAKAATNPESSPASRTTPAQTIPLRKDVPGASAAPAAATTRTPTPAQLTELRRTLLGSGLTSTQIRTRLREQGYSEHLLDADMRGAAAASTPPASKMKPGTPTDTRPSVPAGQPPVRPAPSPTSTKPSSP